MQSVVERHAIGTPLAAIDKMFVELERLTVKRQQQNPIAQLLASIFSDRPSDQYIDAQNQYRTSIANLRYDFIDRLERRMP